MTMQTLKRPRRLAPGDRVAIVAPSGPFPKENLEKGLEVYRSWGLEPVIMPHALDTHDTFWYLAGEDKDRAADFEAAWKDPSIAAIVSARGGYGVQRMLEYVDWDALANYEPKLYGGFSDATALHEAINVKLGVATLHLPMPAWKTFFADGPTQEHVRQTLFEPETVQTIAPDTAKTVVPGKATGVTYGGCVALLSDGIGTPEARTHSRGGILLIEEIEEKDYRLDRMLTQMLRTGWLEGVVGVIMGSWLDSSPRKNLRNTVKDRLGPLGVPIVEDFMFGHESPSWTMPLGVNAVLDADACTLTFEEPVLK